MVVDPLKSVEFKINMCDLKFQYTKFKIDESGYITGEFLMATNETSQG